MGWRSCGGRSSPRAGYARPVDDPDRDPDRTRRSSGASRLRDELVSAARELRSDLRDAAGDLRDVRDEARADLADLAGEVRDELRDGRRDGDADGAVEGEVDAGTSREREAAARSIAILWGTDEPPRRGPRATLSRDAIVATAIELADAEGLEAVSMRTVAKILGVGTMSLYRHVPGKDELVALMVDRVNGEVPDVAAAGGTWRERLELWAWADWELAHRHPWVLDAPGGIGRPVAGPNSMAAYEACLAVAAESGMPARDVVDLVSAVTFLVDGAARPALDSARVQRRTGLSNEDWWLAQEEVLDGVITAERFPTFVALAEAGAFGGWAAEDDEADFRDPIDFEATLRAGLGALLDGAEARAARVATDRSTDRTVD